MEVTQLEGSAHFDRSLWMQVPSGRQERLVCALVHEIGGDSSVVKGKEFDTAAVAAKARIDDAVWKDNG